MAVFKARARALDMLGRQQIAGIPTAISELFKNAHDAYADHVEVDYYRSDNLFVLRDDGLGMTRREFEQRWLTLGTDSRLSSEKGLASIPKDPDKDERPILGEKGIGRLAIASIGNQVLVLTRAKRANEDNELVAAFIHWGLFSLPGIDLDQIQIPLVTFPNGSMPEEQDIVQMAQTVQQNLFELVDMGAVSVEYAQPIHADLDEFISRTPKIDGYPGSLRLSGKSHGTHFIIYPASNLIQPAIDIGKDDDWNAPDLVKMLLGFTNTMIPGAPPPVIKTSFRDHKSEEEVSDLIEDLEFFTEEEFSKADHHIQGEVDAFGQFKGSITVYDHVFPDHIIPWTDARGNPTSCGPFKVNIAYLQGTLKDTKLNPEDHNALLQKLNRFGGIYIYKNGIRILPYGNTDFDFLEIEKRRTKSAGFYYFSYRRMFGVIEISKKDNPDLIEKAGREGFIQNKAYRQFKGIAENIFLQLAHDFFREEGLSRGPNAEVWDTYRKALQRNYQVKQANEKKQRGKKKKFVNELNLFFSRCEQGDPENEISALLSITESTYKNILLISDPDEASKAFLEEDLKARRELGNIRDKYSVSKPRGVGINKKIQFDWQAYQKEFNELEVNLFSPASQKIEEMANSVERKLEVIDRRFRFEQEIHLTKDEVKKATWSESRRTREILKKLRENVIELTRTAIAEMDEEINKVLSNISSLNIANMDDETFVSERTMLVERLQSKAEREREILEGIRDQLENVTWTKTEDGEIITYVDIKEVLEEENLALQERADLDLELSQLGAAISIIQHEFDGTIKSIKRNLKKLKVWADVDKDMEKVYDSIRHNFEHLDGYLTLFQPLNRRMHRKQIVIRGDTIADFIEDLFSERVRRHNLLMEFSDAFNNKEVIGYPSSLYPIFINIVDNAIFWLKDIPVPRRIVFDADSEGYIISNNGPRISPRDEEIIFEQSFTRKENGRGLGLYISREVLSKIGYSIYVASPQPEMTVTFRIDSNRTESNESEEIHA